MLLDDCAVDDDPLVVADTTAVLLELAIPGIELGLAALPDCGLVFAFPVTTGPDGPTVRCSAAAPAGVPVTPDLSLIRSSARLAGI